MCGSTSVYGIEPIIFAMFPKEDMGDISNGSKKSSLSNADSYYDKNGICVKSFAK